MMESILSRNLSSGEAFREARKEMKLSQMQLAKLLGMSVPSVSRIEIGKANINRRTELAIKMLLMAFYRFTNGNNISSEDAYKLLSKVFLGHEGDRAEDSQSDSGQGGEVQPVTA